MNIEVHSGSALRTWAAPCQSISRIRSSPLASASSTSRRGVAYVVVEHLRVLEERVGIDHALEFFA